MAIRQRPLIPAAVLLLTWVVAGVANANQFMMGYAPSAFGAVATLVAVGAWPLAGSLAGRRFGSGFLRLAMVFWIAVVTGGPLVLWALNALPGLTASQGGWLLPLLLFTLVAPVYGLAAALPSWEPAVQTAVIGVAVYTMTLAAYLAGQRIGRPTA